MSILALAIFGGIISAVSTSAGAFLAPIFRHFELLRKYHMSMDFALGVMMSAVAFSLVGPELIKGQSLSLVLAGLGLGAIFILATHKIISFLNRHERFNSYKILLISALIFHNFPEGMGAGASLAGMTFQEAIPLQIAISIQNIVEGLLLTLLLQGLGLNLFWSVLGGMASGLIEFSGALTAGFFMQGTTLLLPFFLALAGGAMMMSVLLELFENYSQGKRIAVSQFITGLMVIPFTNLLFL